MVKLLNEFYYMMFIPKHFVALDFPKSEYSQECQKYTPICDMCVVVNFNMKKCWCFSVPTFEASVYAWFVGSSIATLVASLCSWVVATSVTRLGGVVGSVVASSVLWKKSASLIPM